ncbi:hypothetical protein CRENBAI_012812 [Crenichthys baileyi]|uniref:Uncharacterized protein n=1 Tax=Crenichthys baileyi TaxID=28760 RepID=A0AAV9R6M0_9TELE
MARECSFTDPAGTQHLLENPIVNRRGTTMPMVLTAFLIGFRRSISLDLRSYRISSTYPNGFSCRVGYYYCLCLVRSTYACVLSTLRPPSTAKWSINTGSTVHMAFAAAIWFVPRLCGNLEISSTDATWDGSSAEAKEHLRRPSQTPIPHRRARHTCFSKPPIRMEKAQSPLRSDPAAKLASGVPDVQAPTHPASTHGCSHKTAFMTCRLIATRVDQVVPHYGQSATAALHPKPMGQNLQSSGRSHGSTSYRVTMVLGRASNLLANTSSQPPNPVGSPPARRTTTANSYGHVCTRSSEPVLLSQRTAFGGRRPHFDKQSQMPTKSAYQRPPLAPPTQPQPWPKPGAEIQGNPSDPRERAETPAPSTRQSPNVPEPQTQPRPD